MNIFWFHDNSKINAQMHCDKHVVKMPLELAQLLSSAHHINNSKYAASVYKLAHPHHPCTKWVASSHDAYVLTYNLYLRLLDEYTYRYEKFHKSGNLKAVLRNNPSPVGVPLPPRPLAMPDEYKSSDANYSYRRYFNEEKQHIAFWSCRDNPDWFIRK